MTDTTNFRKERTRLDALLPEPLARDQRLAAWNFPNIAPPAHVALLSISIIVVLRHNDPIPGE